jgi:hypothetical protein
MLQAIEEREAREEIHERKHLEIENGRYKGHF